MFANWVTQTISLHAGEDFIHVTYTVGPIPFQDGLGREVVSVWNSGLCSSVSVLASADHDWTCRT